MPRNGQGHGFAVRAQRAVDRGTEGQQGTAGGGQGDGHAVKYMVDARDRGRCQSRAEQQMPGGGQGYMQSRARPPGGGRTGQEVMSVKADAADARRRKTCQSKAKPLTCGPWVGQGVARHGGPS